MSLKALQSDKQKLKSQRIVTSCETGSNGDVATKIAPKTVACGICREQTWFAKWIHTCSFIFQIMLHDFHNFSSFLPSPSPVLSCCRLWTCVTLSEEREQANVREKKPPLKGWGRTLGGVRSADSSWSQIPVQVYAAHWNGVACWPLKSLLFYLWVKGTSALLDSPLIYYFYPREN